jgi:hypothetical protein
MTLAELARAMNLRGPSSIQAYFNPDYDTHIKPKIGLKLRVALVGRGEPPITAEEIWALQGVDTDFVRRWNEAGESFENAKAVGIEPQVLEAHTPPTMRGHPKDVPAYASALAADIEFDSNGVGTEPVEMTVFQMNDVVAHVRRPPGIPADRSVYVVFVSGESMSPRFRPGEPVFVDPKRPPSIGDDVVVQLVGDSECGEIVTGLIKTLVKRTASHLELEQYKPDLRFSVPVDRIARVHRVIPWSECFGI